MLGYSADELLGTSFFELNHADDRDRARREFVAVMHGSDHTACWESLKRCRNGSIVWVGETAYGIRNSDGLCWC